MSYFGGHLGIFCAILDLFRFIGIKRWTLQVKLLNLLNKTTPRITGIYFWEYFQREAAGRIDGEPDFGISLGN